MSELTETLKKDHAVILAALRTIKKMGLAHAETPRKLVLAKAALLAHLKHEDVELYPVLKEAALSDLAIQAKLKVLAEDLEGLAGRALRFFAKYENGGPEDDFDEDFHELEFALKTRIRREEETLYALYDTITKNARTAA